MQRVFNKRRLLYNAVKQPWQRAMKKKEDGKTILAARAPQALVRKLARAAKSARRSRSAEMLLRLEESLAREPVLLTKVA